MFSSLYSPALDWIIQQKSSPPVFTEEMLPPSFPICSHQQGTGVATLQICEVCSGSNRVLSVCISSSQTLFPAKLHTAFVYSTAHNMAAMRQEKNVISLSFVLLFILKSVFIIASTWRAPLKGLCIMSIWALGCVNKTFSVHQVFSMLKPFCNQQMCRWATSLHSFSDVVLVYVGDSYLRPSCTPSSGKAATEI